MSVWELYTQLFARNCRCGRMKWLSWSIQIPQFLMLWWPAMKAGSTATTQRPKDRVLSGSMLALPNPRRPVRANPPTFDDPFVWQHWHDLHALGSHLKDSQQGILCWGFKGVQKEIPSEEASNFQIGSAAYPPGQCTSPQLYPCHRPFDQDGINTVPYYPYIVKTLLLVTFGYSLSSRKNLEAVVMRQLGRWKRLWQEDSNGTFQKLLERYNKCIAARGD